jgi:hypothetical protein
LPPDTPFPGTFHYPIEVPCGSQYDPKSPGLYVAYRLYSHLTAAYLDYRHPLCGPPLASRSGRDCNLGYRDEHFISCSVWFAKYRSDISRLGRGLAHAAIRHDGHLCAWTTSTEVEQPPTPTILKLPAPPLIARKLCGAPHYYQSRRPPKELARAFAARPCASDVPPARLLPARGL